MNAAQVEDVDAETKDKVVAAIGQSRAEQARDDKL